MGFFSRLFGRSDSEEKDKKEYKYELIDGGSYRGGRGYRIRRVSDQKIVEWQYLPEADGLETFSVAGIWRRRKDSGLSWRPGWALILAPETDNPKDPNAVAVWDMGMNSQLGYVPKERAQQIGEGLRAGKYKYCLFVWRSLSDAGYCNEAKALLVGHGASLLLPRNVKAMTEHRKATLPVPEQSNREP
jgi:hypothetical protein